jgi:hypothetical protein
MMSLSDRLYPLGSILTADSAILRAEMDDPKFALFDRFEHDPIGNLELRRQLLG